MKIPPVSFGSLMVIKINKPGNQLPIKDEVGLSFPDQYGDGGNPALRDYRLSDTFHHEDKIDGTVWNATKNFASSLDRKYREQENLFQDNPRKVIFTEADFYVSPQKTDKKYFLTAATQEDEDKIHKILSQSSRYLVAKWHK